MIDIQKAAISSELPEASKLASSRIEGQDKGFIENASAAMTVELEEAGKEETSALKERQRQIIDSLDLKKCVPLLFEA